MLHYVYDFCVCKSLLYIARELWQFVFGKANIERCVTLTFFSHFRC